MSAIIYQFPVGGRAAFNNLRDEAKPAIPNYAPAAITACGSAWYHEQAIKDEEPKRPH